MITLGQLKTALDAIEGIDVGSLKKAVASSFGDLSADATVAEDALGILAIFFPEVGAIAALIAVLVELQPFLGLHIEPDQNPALDTDEYTSARNASRAQDVQ